MPMEPGDAAKLTDVVVGVAGLVDTQRIPEGLIVPLVVTSEEELHTPLLAIQHLTMQLQAI